MVPATLRAFIDNQVVAHAFPSTSAYLQHLVRREAAASHLREQLLMGEQSGPPIQVNDTYWSDLRQRVSEGRHQLRLQRDSISADSGISTHNFYRYTDDHVVVVRVLHHGRDVEALLQTEGSSST